MNNDEGVLISNAKDLLKKTGYQVDNLWSVNDVKARFKCTDEQAHDILYRALTNSATMEQIWFAIDIEAEIKNLEKKSKIN